MNKILCKNNTKSIKLIVKLFICFLLFIIFSSQYLFSDTKYGGKIRYNGRYRQYRQDFDGKTRIKFTIYDKDGHYMDGTQEITDVKVSSGIFSVAFKPELTDKQWKEDLYLEVTIDKHVLSPREELTCVPKSIYAYNGVPAGAILIWSGSASDIPDGFALCDGTNGTPDLRDRFVLGAGKSYSVNSTGGEEEHTLTKNEIPDHVHGIGSFGSNNGLFGSLTTAVNVDFPGTKSTGWNGSGNGSFNGGNKIDYTQLATSFIVNEEIRIAQSHNNMPPYYSLCYIMRKK